MAEKEKSRNLTVLEWWSDNHPFVSQLKASEAFIPDGEIRADMVGAYFIVGSGIDDDPVVFRIGRVLHCREIDAVDCVIAERFGLYDNFDVMDGLIELSKSRRKWFTTISAYPDGRLRGIGNVREDGFTSHIRDITGFTSFYATRAQLFLALRRHMREESKQ